MKRRGVLLAGAASLAGCTYQSSPGDTDETAAAGGNGDDTSVDAFVAELESKGIAVDSTLMMVGSLSVGYFYRPEKKVQDLTRIALTYADHVAVSNGILSLTAIEADGESRYATYEIEEAWARDYTAGELSQAAYVSNVEDSEIKK